MKLRSYAGLLNFAGKALCAIGVFVAFGLAFDEGFNLDGILKASAALLGFAVLALPFMVAGELLLAYQENAERQATLLGDVVRLLDAINRKP